MARRNNPLSLSDLSKIQVELNSPEVDEWVAINEEDTNSDDSGMGHSDSASGGCGGSALTGPTFIDLVDEVEEKVGGKAMDIKEEPEDDLTLRFKKLIEELKETIENQRQSYTDQQKLHALKIISLEINVQELKLRRLGVKYDESDYNFKVIVPALKITRDFLVTSHIYTNLTASQLQQWHIRGEINKIKTYDNYSRVNKEFEDAVWDKLIRVKG